MLWLRGAIGDGISGGGGDGCGGEPGPKEKEEFGLRCWWWSGWGGNRNWLWESGLPEERFKFNEFVEPCHFLLLICNGLLKVQKSVTEKTYLVLDGTKRRTVLGNGAVVKPGWEAGWPGCCWPGGRRWPWSPPPAGREPTTLFAKTSFHSSDPSPAWQQTEFYFPAPAYILLPQSQEQPFLVAELVESNILKVLNGY